MEPQREPTTDRLRRDIEDRSIHVAADLGRMHNVSSVQHEFGLIFPKCRDDERLRVCEQKAEVLFLLRLLTSPRYRVPGRAAPAAPDPPRPDRGIHAAGIRRRAASLRSVPRSFRAMSCVDAWPCLPCKNPTFVVCRNPTHCNNNKCVFKQIDGHRPPVRLSAARGPFWLKMRETSFLVPSIG